MRRTLTAVACVLLLALCIWLMELVEPVEAPQPTPTEAQPTPTEAQPTPTEAQPTTPTPTPEPTPGTVSIPMPDGFDGDLDRLWVGIEIEGMPE